VKPNLEEVDHQEISCAPDSAEVPVRLALEIPELL